MGDNRTIDYLDPKSLLRFINDQGKILPRRITGVNAYQQRQICKAIKYARHLALLPFVTQDVR
ncbi:MAG: 30S ribosomal protein S18 [Candidatus Kapaibacterium sp.]